MTKQYLKNFSTKLVFKLISKSISKCIFIFFFYSISGMAYADFGQVAQNVLEPVTVLSDFLLTACFVIGGCFLFASLIKYIEHRRNPLACPISTVVFLFIGGSILILLPFISMYAGTGPKYSLMR